MDAKPDWDDPTARQAWVRQTVPELLRDEGKPSTLPKLVFLLNCRSNPKRRKKKGEYHFPHEEVEQVLDGMVRDYLLDAEVMHVKYDPKEGRRRYWFSNTLEALARAASE